jgi:glycosyltransferase involved in cell wall biosynthesis
MPRSILFIGREPTRTGAPIALLGLMRWLKSRTDWSLNLVVPARGELIEDFEAIASVVVADRLSRAEATGGQLVIPVSAQPDLMYYNTVASFVVPPANIPALCHVHELGFALRAWAGPTPAPVLLGRFDRFIACSQAVRKNLIDNHRIPADRIDLVYEFISTSAVDAWVGRPDASTWLGERLGLAPQTHIVGCAGTIEWRKGPDLFVQLARTVLRHRPEFPVHFVWLGGDPTSLDGYKFQHDIRQAGLEKRITVIASVPDPLRYLAAFDVFALTSREDPFPLVCLESAACGKPIVCFDSAGGMPEFVEKDCGLVVPYLDMEAMSDAICRLLDDPAARAAMGRAGQRKVRQRCDVSVAGPKILESIETTLRGRASAGA